MLRAVVAQDALFHQSLKIRERTLARIHVREQRGVFHVFQTIVRRHLNGGKARENSGANVRDSRTQRAGSRAVLRDAHEPQGRLHPQNAKKHAAGITEDCGYARTRRSPKNSMATRLETSRWDRRMPFLMFSDWLRRLTLSVNSSSPRRFDFHDFMILN
eukprot:scaffold1311_cov256-Pinguiococcus_pyrenoidosus.AAC.44